MKMIAGCAKWSFWKLFYLLQKEPTDFGDWIKRSLRIMPPWRKFTPNAWHNDAGRMWEVYFSSNSCYTVVNQKINVCLQYSDDTGEVVGFSVSDYELNQHKRETIQ